MRAEPKPKDSEIAEFEAALLRSIDEMNRGEYAAVHTPVQIEARKRGRPAGTAKAAPGARTRRSHAAPERG